jgi:fluoride exporter
MLNILLVAAGGALGSLLRYAVVLLLKPHSPTFPTGTLIVNLIGCLLIGLLAGLWGASISPTDRLKLFLFMGILGGFTTFSSFGLETAVLLRDGRTMAAIGYIVASNAIGLPLALIGMALTGRTPASMP